MSLVSGLLNKSCTIIRQPMKSDGKGAWIPDGSATTIATGVLICINQRSADQVRHEGGREIVSTHTGFMEYRPEGLFLPNDMVSEVFLNSNPTQFDLDIVNTPDGQKTVHRIYQLQTVYDPNGERDHLEADIIVYKGRRPIL